MVHSDVDLWIKSDHEILIRSNDGSRESGQSQTKGPLSPNTISEIIFSARSCRFALHNIRKTRPFLTQHTAQLLVQALVISRLDYYNALLAGLPSCSFKLLQMIQNAAARLVFSEPKRAHVTPLFISLHWLPFAAQVDATY